MAKRQRVYLQVECLLDPVGARPGPFNTPAGAAGAVKNFLEGRSPERDWDVAILDDEFLIARAEHNLGAAGMLPSNLTQEQELNRIALEKAMEWAEKSNVIDAEVISQTAVRFAVMLKQVADE